MIPRRGRPARGPGATAFLARALGPDVRPRALSLGAMVTGTIAALAIVVSVGGPIPALEGPRTLLPAGTTATIPGWTNLSDPNLLGSHSGIPGLYSLSFQVRVASTLSGTLSAAFAFGFLLGAPGAVDAFACELDQPPPPCAPPPLGGGGHLFVGGNTSSTLDLGGLTLDFSTGANALPAGAWELLLYNTNTTADPLTVTSAVVVAAAW